MRRLHAALAAAVAAALATGLAGCGGNSGKQVSGRVATDAAAHPVVAVAQARTILNAVDLSLAAGARQATLDGYGGRITGPYRDLVAAQVKSATIRKVGIPVPPQMDRLALLVPSASGWPRFFVAAGRESGGATPILQVLYSAGPRQPYALWGQLTMMPGVTLPAVESADVGAPELGPDTTGLALTPRQTVQLMAQYMTQGPRSPGAVQIRGSSLADEALRRFKADRQNLKAVATVASTHVADPSQIFAMRTSDGGALVIGALLQRYVITVKKGAGTVKLSQDPTLAALAGTQQFAKSFTRTAVELVAFEVPPQGRGRITVVAAEKGDVGAAAS